MSTNNDVNHLIFFGDSICVGQGVSIHKGWVTRVAARVESLAEQVGLNLVVFNASVNGSTTRQALERMPYEIQSHGVSILLTQFGMNDCNYWESDQGLPRVSPRAFAANLEEIITRAINFGAQRVLLNTNHPTTHDRETFPNTGKTYESSNAAYNRIVREVARKFSGQAVLNDVEMAFHNHVRDDRDCLGELLLADGLHLSEAGHDIYFGCVLPAVEAAVTQLATTATATPRAAGLAMASE